MRAAHSSSGSRLPAAQIRSRRSAASFFFEHAVLHESVDDPKHPAHFHTVRACDVPHPPITGKQAGLELPREQDARCVGQTHPILNVVGDHLSHVCGFDLFCADQPRIHKTRHVLPLTFLAQLR